MNPRQKKIISIFLLFLFSGSILGLAANMFMTPKTDDDPNTIVVIETSLGDIEIELDAENAPITVANFLQYVEDEYYEGLCFHRVIYGFMIQGGGYEPNGDYREANDPIVLESDNGLSNINGTIAMARSTDPDTATSQFFINVADNTALDYASEEYPGYAVFGRVVSGMDVVMDIARVTTGDHTVYYSAFDYSTTFEDWPLESVEIISVYVKEG